MSFMKFTSSSPLFTCLLTFWASLLIAQSPARDSTGVAEVHARLIDAKTGDGIPYASIVYGEQKGVITNEEGRFRIALRPGEQVFDSLQVTSMGYEEIRLPLSPEMDTLIRVSPRAIDLQGVYVFNKEISLEEILENTWNHLGENYRDGFHKSRFFIRKSSLNQWSRFDAEFKKSSIPELSKAFLDSVWGTLPRGGNYYQEALGDWYHGPGSNKVTLIKAAELYDKSQEVSIEGLAEQLEDIFKKNVKPDSYLKIKSGIIGTKIPVDSILQEYEEAKEVEEEVKDNKSEFYFNRIKGLLTSLTTDLYIRGDDTQLPVIEKARKYRYSLNGYNEIDGQGVFVVDFEPKGVADYRGTLFIGMEDFAILQMDFENVKRLRNIRLLGFMYRENTYHGSIRFAKGPEGNYLMKFGRVTKGNQFGVRRPLKIVEKNKNVRGRRKQNELSMDLDLVADNTEIYEWVIFDSDAISETTLKEVSENKTFQPTYMPRYDPEFWSGATTLEPNAAIRSFQAVDQE